MQQPKSSRAAVVMLFAVVAGVFANGTMLGQEVVKFAEDKISLQVPKKWEKKKPRSRIVEYEFAVAPVEGDEQPLRITMMGAGGSVQANIDRWKSQFSFPAGEAEKAFKAEKGKIEGQEVHVVDISGTFKESVGGPFSRTAPVQRPNYRMLAAIIVTKHGQYFIKMYGPQKTVAAQAKPFREMLDTLKVQ